MKTDDRKQPNILLIMADELAPQATPMYGHAVVRAPHMARLAARGVVFENAYTNSPLCAPARAALMTGRLAPKIGAWDNASELPASIPTIAHYLRHLGYETCLVGKMHFVGPDQLHGFEERLTTDIYPANFAWTANWGLPPTAPNPAGVSMRPVVESGWCERNMQIDYDNEVEHRAVEKIYDLARREAGAPPFFLTVSFTQPHPPFLTDREHWDLYTDAEIDMPRIPALPLEALDEASRCLYYNQRRNRFRITEEHVRRARRAYYGMISDIDDKVGRLLAALDRAGLADNTLIVLTSDHGEMLGERGMWFKQSMYEWSVRVPLVIALPERFQPKRVSGVVSLVDLLPTLVDVASNGAPPEPADPLDGSSLVGMLENGDDSNRAGCAIADFNAGGAPGPIRMVRAGRYKYVHTHGHPSLLFDLETDPDELVNLAGRPEVREAEDALRSVALEGYNPESIRAEVIASQRRRLFIRTVDERSNRYPNWSYEARPGDSKRYVRAGGLHAGEHATKARSRVPYIAPAEEDL
jgi:choline-sulfatase